MSLEFIQWVIEFQEDLDDFLKVREFFLFFDFEMDVEEYFLREELERFFKFFEFFRNSEVYFY